ncbi:Membrane-spanning 4-domains subfamily A member 15 [Tupaia chinensis]|uniref:Membrane-spanning 4-domains subfamily A member 15 n=1 Tax=Tupaia chinensis TaxID=246437 RepID=L8Y9G8_TUPCH|nr:Membrane-spanning 4-domains subfamily A member 15 [Tupaia chinensis]
MSAAPASNGVFVVIPPSNASGLRPPSAILPTSMCQPPGIMQFEEPPLGVQTPRATQPPDLRPLETFLTGEPKALGTVQILIGLIHLGFGSVLLMVRRGHVGMLFIEGGVPFWGGACVRSSLGTNILSSMAAFAGTAILLMDFGVTNWDVGRGYLAVLTIFTILEFFIAVIATHFGCQATRTQANTPVIFLPNAFSTDFNIPSPAASPPPAYDNVAYMPKESSDQGPQLKSMAAEANRAAPGIPSSGTGELLPYQTSLPQGVAQPGLLAPNWHQGNVPKRSGVLQELGVFHVILALLHVGFGGYLASTVRTLHLVVLKSWYPLWGAFSKVLCLVTNLISFLCTLAGIFIIAKDLFLESPFESPIWRMYPNSTVHIQRLELALLCFTFLEFFLPGTTAIIAYREDRLSEKKDGLSVIPNTPLELRGLPEGLPPSYENVTQSNAQDEHPEVKRLSLGCTDPQKSPMASVLGQTGAIPKEAVSRNRGWC